MVILATDNYFVFYISIENLLFLQLMLTEWLHWVQTYYLRVDEPLDTSDIPATCGTCYYGQCGLTGKCECADGYQGDDCGTGRCHLFCVFIL